MDDPSFLGISADEWKDIFSLAKILIPGVILALFAAYYKNWKTEEIKLEGQIARLRIKAYDTLVGLMSQAVHTIDPSLKEESIFRPILENYEFPDMNVDYSAVCHSEKSFDDYYHSVSDCIRENEMYLNHQTLRQARASLGIFTQFKLMLDAFCDTERHLTKNPIDAQKKIDMAYRFLGICLKSEINRSFIQLENNVIKQLKHLQISYKQSILSQQWGQVRDAFLRIANLYMEDEGWKGRLANWFLFKVMKGPDMAIVVYLSDFVEVLPYIHISNRYTPAQYYSMDDEKRWSVTHDFLQELRQQMNDGRPGMI